MPDGYKGSSREPVPSWWMDQIRCAEDFRKEYACEDRWSTWRDYVRGRWDPDVMAVNIFHSMLRTTIPRVYFRNPTVSVRPDHPGFLNMAFAQVVGRVDNRMIHEMEMKTQMKKIVMNAFLFGTGAGKVGYGSTYGNSAEQPMVKGERFDYDSGVQSNKPWFRSVHPGHFFVQDESESLNTARFWGHKIKIPIDDAKRHPLFRKKSSNIAASSVIETQKGKIDKPIEMIELIEIHDKKFQNQFIIAPFSSGESGVLWEGEDELQLWGSFGLFPLVFNTDDEVFWGIPDSVILEPTQLELNETRTLMMKHRRLAIVKWLIEQGAIQDEEIDKLLSPDVGAVVKVNKNPNLVASKTQTSNVPQDLFMAMQEYRQDYREMMGFSRNQTGEYQNRRGDVSATEAAEVAEASEIRVDERRDALADLMVRAVSCMNSVLFSRWTAQDVVEVIGPGGAQVWVKYDPQSLRYATYRISIDPDTGTPKTRNLREAKAARVYEILKTNPLIDPVGLTRYLLTEIEGVEMDDLMIALPPMENGMGSSPGNAVGMGDFAGMIQSGFQRAQQGAGNPMLAMLAGQGGRA